MMLQSPNFFTKMVDEIVRFSHYDEELSEGVRWLDSESKKRGISFYDMVFIVLYKVDNSKRASKWLNGRFRN